MTLIMMTLRLEHEGTQHYEAELVSTQHSAFWHFDTQYNYAKLTDVCAMTF
jgi:hypothetical protein